MLKQDISGIIDIKKVSKGGSQYWEFKKSVQKYGYDVQQAFYYMGAKVVFGEEIPHRNFLFLTVEETQPYIPNLLPLSESFFQIGMHVYEAGLDKFQRYLEDNNAFPWGYGPVPTEDGCVHPDDWYDPGFMRLRNLE